MARQTNTHWHRQCTWCNSSHNRFMGIKQTQIPHTHTLRPCPNLPLSPVLHRQADSHVETFSPALRVLSARCLSLSNQRKPNWTHWDDSGKGLEAHGCLWKQVCRVSTHWTHVLVRPGQSRCALLCPVDCFHGLGFQWIKYKDLSIADEREGRSVVWRGQQSR